MRDWLERPGEPASDLDLVVLLLNSLDLLEDPPDRLTDLTWLGEVFAAVGRDDIAGALAEEDLAGLRSLRESLRAAAGPPAPASGQAGQGEGWSPAHTGPKVATKVTIGLRRS